MGVQGLARFLTGCCVETGSNAISKRHFGDYKGKLIAIDAMQRMFSYGIAIRKGGYDKVSRDGKSINHLYAIFNYVRFLIRHKIKPFFVFEGKSPGIKSGTLLERRVKRKTASDKCSEIEDKTSSEFRKQFMRSYGITYEDIEECKRLLTAFGFPYCEAVGEADSQCAALATGDSDFYGTITEDIDSIVFGSPHMLKDFSGKHDMATDLSHDGILQALLDKANSIRADKGLSLLEKFRYTDFINFVSMLETDYYNGLKSPSINILFQDFVICDMDVVKLVSYIEKVNAVFIERRKNCLYSVPKDFIDDWTRVKTYYEEAEVIPPANINKTFVRPNRTAIFNILYDQCNFDRETVERMIFELEDFYTLINCREAKRCWEQNVDLEEFNSMHLSLEQRTDRVDHSYDSFESYQQKYGRRLFDRKKYRGAVQIRSTV